MIQNAQSDAERRDVHDYLSTACFHGLHDRCRKSCKFCGTNCKCYCHDAASRLPEGKEPPK